MTLKEAKKEIKELLIAKKKKELIEKLKYYFNNEDLKKEFEGIVPKTFVDDTLQGEEFKEIENNKKYCASNLGRIKLNMGNKPVVPQRLVECNWYLDAKKFREKNDDFEGIRLAGDAVVYDYFMKETEWLKEEYDEIQKIYPDCELQLHHICQNGDNRIDNMIYLPAYIHRAVHQKKSS